MATYSQTPGYMALQIKSGDSFSALVDFDISFVGYSVSAAIYSAVNGQKIADFTTSATDAAGGKVNISLTKQQTDSISPGTYVWQMTSTSGSTYSRSYLEGIAEVF